MSNPPERSARTFGRRLSLAWLGVFLARRGVIARISLGIAGLTVVAAIVAAFLMARGPRPPLEHLPPLTASVLAWGAGVLIAFAGAAHAFRTDRTEGITALLRARGASARAHVWSRMGGLTLLLALVVGAGTLLGGLVATLVATRAGVALRTLQATCAATVYAAAFALTLGPLAMAALGARSRIGGYGWLVTVLVLPELFAPVTRSVVPSGWTDLVSIPAALGALRGALMPPSVHPWHAAKALFVLALVVLACVLLTTRAAARAHREEAP